MYCWVTNVMKAMAPSRHCWSLKVHLLIGMKLQIAAVESFTVETFPDSKQVKANKFAPNELL